MIFNSELGDRTGAPIKDAISAYLGVTKEVHTLYYSYQTL